MVAAIRRFPSAAAHVAARRVRCVAARRVRCVAGRQVHCVGARQVRCAAERQVHRVAERRVHRDDALQRRHGGARRQVQFIIVRDRVRQYRVARDLRRHVVRVRVHRRVEVASTNVSANASVNMSGSTIVSAHTIVIVIEEIVTSVDVVNKISTAASTNFMFIFC